MLNNRFTFRAWVAGQMVYFKLGDDLPPNWTGWETTMQNTNLLDSKGREIYEGDILTWGGANHVVENQEFFCPECGRSTGFLGEGGEIIGDIYSTPSLIK